MTPGARVVGGWRVTAAVARPAIATRLTLGCRCYPSLDVAGIIHRRGSVQRRRGQSDLGQLQANHPSQIGVQPGA